MTKLQHMKELMDQDLSRNDLDILNMIYHFYKLNMTELKDDYDFELLYDNLNINSEIIDCYNIDEYREYLEKNHQSRSFKWYKEQTEKGYFFLLDVYLIKGGVCSRFDCFCKFKKGFNIFHE